MGIESLIGFLIIGIIAGWLAGRIFHGSGFGLVGNMAVGVVGAFIGGLLIGFLNIPINGTLGALLAATVGAIVLLFMITLVKR